MRFIVIAILALIVIVSHVWAGDEHQRGDGGHRIVYVVTDSSGNPVSGQTIRLAAQRVSDDAFWDFNDSSWKYSGWTTRLQTMNYHVVGEYYGYTFSFDVAHPGMISTDIVFILSNDSALYGDQQAEVVNFGTTNNLIMRNR